MSDTIGEFYPIEGLTPHPKNPRQNEQAVSQIARSIERFGFTSPIIAREQDKTIIAGHTRWKAAQKIGLSKVPVVFVNLSVVDAELLMIADNKLGEKADWDTDKLSDLLSELREQGEDLDVLGFDDGELEDLLNDYNDWDSDMDDDFRDLDNQVDSMKDNSRRALMFDFNSDNYEELLPIQRKLRDQDIYIGSVILKSIKDLYENSHIE